MVLTDVMHPVDFAVHGFWRADDLRTEGLSDGLVSEAHTEERHSDLCRLADKVEADAGMIGIGWSGRDDDGLGRQLNGLFDRECIVSTDVTDYPQLTQIVDEIVGKTIVVVD